MKTAFFLQFLLIKQLNELKPKTINVLEWIHLYISVNNSQCSSTCSRFSENKDLFSFSFFVAAELHLILISHPEINK